MQEPETTQDDFHFRSWLGGFVDGEGCFHINKYPEFHLTNTDRQVLEYICENLKQSRVEALRDCKVRLSTMGSEKWKSRYKIQVRGRKAVEWAKFLLPFLRLKTEQANLLIQFPFCNQKPVPHHIMMLREQQQAKMNQLNATGPRLQSDGDCE